MLVLLPESDGKVGAGTDLVEAVESAAAACEYMQWMGGCAGPAAYDTGTKSQWARKNSPRVELYGLMGFMYCGGDAVSSVQDGREEGTYELAQILGEGKANDGEHALERIFRVVDARGTGI